VIVLAAERTGGFRCSGVAGGMASRGVPNLTPADINLMRTSDCAMVVPACAVEWQAVVARATLTLWRGPTFL